MLSEDTDELVVNTYEIDSRFKTMRKSTYLNENQFHSEQHTRRASFLSHIS